MKDVVTLEYLQLKVKEVHDHNRNMYMIASPKQSIVEFNSKPCRCPDEIHRLYVVRDVHSSSTYVAAPDHLRLAQALLTKSRPD